MTELTKMHLKIQKAKKCNKCQHCLYKTDLIDTGKKRKMCTERFVKMFNMDFGVRNCKYYKKKEKENV